MRTLVHARRLRTRAAARTAAKHKRRGGVLVALAAVAAKLKSYLLLLAKWKLLFSTATALASIAAYSLSFGWPFAAGLVALLAVHELGHVIQLRREGCNASLLVFIPFLGAVIAARSLGDDALAEARVGLAGPILGTAAATTLAAAGVWTGSHFLLALAYSGLLLNLFNLLPVLPLDGGRAMAAVAPWMWSVGLVALIAVMVIVRLPGLLVIVLFSGMELRSRRRSRRLRTPTYYQVPRSRRMLVAGTYVALVTELGVGMTVTHLAGAVPS